MTGLLISIDSNVFYGLLKTAEIRLALQFEAFVHSQRKRGNTWWRRFIHDTENQINLERARYLYKRESIAEALLACKYSDVVSVPARELQAFCAWGGRPTDIPTLLDDLFVRDARRSLHEGNV